MIMVWHFYYRVLPPRLTLKENHGEAIALNDPPTLKQSLRDIASVAFTVTLDGQSAPLQPIDDELTMAPDGGVQVRLVYPGRPGGHLHVQDNMLAYYPAGYVINYQFSSPVDRWRGTAGYLVGGHGAAAVDYVQLAQDFKPSPLDWFNASPVVLFKSTLRTAWINPNWLLLAIIVLLTRPFAEVVRLGGVMAGAWSLPCYFWANDGLQIPWAIHPVLPALGTGAFCLLNLRFQPGFRVLAWTLFGVGVLNGGFDIQQTSLERPFLSFANFAGLCAGFVVGLGLVFAIGFPIVAECRKAQDFQSAWAPKICWAAGGLALVLPWVRT